MVEDRHVVFPQELRRAIRLTRYGMPTMLMVGNCGACGRSIAHLHTLARGEERRKAFETFWEHLEVDCRIANGEEA